MEKKTFPRSKSNNFVCIIEYAKVQDGNISPSAQLPKFPASAGIGMRLPENRSWAHNVRASAEELRRKNSTP